MLTVIINIADWAAVSYNGAAAASLRASSHVRHSCAQVLNSDIGIGARRMTISTVGVPGAIARLAAAGLQSTLAVSIHAASQRLREQLIPRSVTQIVATTSHMVEALSLGVAKGVGSQCIMAQSIGSLSAAALLV